jgi:hypothetical protein
MAQIDFEGNQQTNTNPSGGAGNEPNNGNNNNPANQDDITHLDGGDVDDITGKDNNPNNNPNPDGNGNNNDNQPSHDIEEGTEVEFDGAVYKVDDKGNLVDKDGKVFKEAKDVKQWLDDNGFSDEGDEPLSLESIQQTVGVEITDETGKPVEFTNDAAGVKSYIDAVIQTRSNEIQQGAINKLYQDNPLLKQFIDYVQIKGTARGFGEIPDRSGIQLDKDNEAQLEAVIRMAASEFGNKSLNDNYIKYLKTTGSLYDEAKMQLEALVNKDKQVRADIEAQAEAERIQEQKEIEDYWKGVDKAISERRIGGYLLPETIVKEVNGQKITYKLADFYDYVSKPTESDANGNRLTGYSRDLNKLSDKELLDRELLDAWLLWTGGSFKDLVNMAIKEDNVRRLVAKSKENKAQRHIKVNKPTESGNKAQLIYE